MKTAAISWHEAYLSESYKKAKGNRLKIVIPLLSLFTILYMGLFTIQSYGKAIGQISVFGYVDVGFLVVMSLFPLTGLMGFAFMKYTEKHVYPYEDAVIEEFGSTQKEKNPTVELHHDAVPVKDEIPQVA